MDRLKIIGCALIWGSLLAGCNPVRHVSTEYKDLNRDGVQEKIVISTNDGTRHRTFMRIEELRQKGNSFYRGAEYNMSFDVPISPFTTALRDVNSDGYPDIILHPRHEDGLESYVIEQTGTGGFYPPREYDSEGLLLLSRAEDFYRRSEEKAEKGEVKAAIHLSEMVLSILDTERTAHHSMLGRTYEHLRQLHSTEGDAEKAQEMETDLLNLRMYRGRI